MEIRKEFEIIYKGEGYRIELPQIIFDSEWKNHLANPIKVKILGLGIADSMDIQGKPTRKEIGKVKFEVEPEFQIQSNSTRRVKTFLKLTKEELQIFQKEGLLRVQVSIPITLLTPTEQIEKVVRTDKTIMIRIPPNNSILEFILE